MAEDPLKYKGRDRWNPRTGLGRLRRANGKEEARLGSWESRVDDEAFLDSQAGVGKRTHAGETLLARFNRLAMAMGASGPAEGEAAEICGFEGRTPIVRRSTGEELPCEVRRVLQKQVTGVKNPLCIGDRVRLVHAPGPVITAIEPRRNQLARADSHNRALIHVFAANLDRLVIVSALHDPDLKRGLIDRYLVLAAQCDIPALLVITKCDLGDPTEAVRLYESCGVPVFPVDARINGPGIDALREHLRGLACVVAGQSGVGKSTLVNVIHPGFFARIGRIAQAGHGRHTTTAARSELLPDGGRLVDTPGIRECAVTGLTGMDVALLMPDLAKLQPRCRFPDCSHRHEPDCAVLAAVQGGTLAASRYESYRSMVEEDLAVTG